MWVAGRRMRPSDTLLDERPHKARQRDAGPDHKATYLEIASWLLPILPARAEFKLETMPGAALSRELGKC